MRARTCGVRDSRGGEFRSFLKQPTPIIFAALSCYCCARSRSLGCGEFRCASVRFVALWWHCVFILHILGFLCITIALSLSLSPDFGTAFQFPETTSKNWVFFGFFWFPSSVEVSVNALERSMEPGALQGIRAT